MNAYRTLANDILLRNEWNIEKKLSRKCALKFRIDSGQAPPLLLLTISYRRFLPSSALAKCTRSCRFEGSWSTIQLRKIKKRKILLTSVTFSSLFHSYSATRVILFHEISIAIINEDPNLNR